MASDAAGAAAAKPPSARARRVLASWRKYARRDQGGPPRGPPPTPRGSPRGRALARISPSAAEIASAKAQRQRLASLRTSRFYEAEYPRERDIVMVKVEVEELCKKVSWPLFKQYGDAYDALRRHVNGEIDLWKELDFSKPGKDLSGIAEQLKKDIEASIRRRLGQQRCYLRAKIEVSCAGYEGIDAVREALSKGLEASKPECELKINLLAHPIFAISCTCLDEAVGVATIDAAMDLIERSIQASGGIYRMRSHPQLAGGQDLFLSDASDSEGESSSDEGSDESDLERV